MMFQRRLQAAIQQQAHELQGHQTALQCRRLRLEMRLQQIASSPAFVAFGLGAMAYHFWRRWKK